MGPTAAELQLLVVASLERQGFRLNGAEILPPLNQGKEVLRALHSEAVRHRVEKSEKRLVKYERALLKRLASGDEVVPEAISPRLIEVTPESEEELLFRYSTLHWSVPVSSGYGRRLRFLVVDEQNGKLMGLFGLGDPVFSLFDRDQWIGWNKEACRARLNHVVDAFVLGGVPPYTFLLCGKLVAMLVASNEVREAFRRKYAGAVSLIQQRKLDAGLALITTTSALGRSSLYNRIRYDGRVLYQSVGFTRGSGEFHFSNGVYDALVAFAGDNCEPTAKNYKWGSGFRSRREVVRKCLSKLGLSADWLYHGIRREIFAVPLACNTQEFLRGEGDELNYFNQPAADLYEWFRTRWLIPRSRQDHRYKAWTPAEWAIWAKDSTNA